ncbi:cadherin EGF LAG seven-pass G-type receptor 2-like isoform X2 [Pseudophryne corroboree]|uniref:cadherin EGF LAG seven-pass G-type receptor 2-like isoform X2 n=1 Tax=Pseudophryne corroboree TaxID=495146 RepID=UPI003081843C
MPTCDGERLGPITSTGMSCRMASRDSCVLMNLSVSLEEREHYDMAFSRSHMFSSCIGNDILLVKNTRGFYDPFLFGWKWIRHRLLSCLCHQYYSRYCSGRLGSIGIYAPIFYMLLLLPMALGLPHPVLQGNCSLSLVQEESILKPFTSIPSLMLSWTCISPAPTNLPSILAITSEVKTATPLRPHTHIHVLTTIQRRSVSSDKPSELCIIPRQALLPLPDVQPSPWGICQLQCWTIGYPGATLSNGMLFTSFYHCLSHQNPLDLKLHCQPCSELESKKIILHWRVMLPQLPMKTVDNHGIPRSKRNINNSPQFQTPSYQVSVPENKPAGTFVVHLRASDPDGGDFGKLEYSMDALFDSRSSKFFSLDPATGEVTTAAVLDRETKSTHVFRVTVSDAGIPRRTAMATLTVTVSDTNDHDPTFEQIEYRESVRENMEVGYEVMTVRATDSDALMNANIAYCLISGSGEVFEIDPRSGVIRTKGPVDREKRAFYQLLVEANDQGNDPGPRSSTTTVHISVEDENDNAPQFSEKRYVAHVPEDAALDSKVLVVTATDRDQGANAAVHYSILSGNARGLFSIDPQSGAIYLAGALDFETGKEHSLRVRAQDGGRPPLSNVTGLVSVQVLDVNDNAPAFVSGPFQAAVLENAPLGYSVLQVQALDADSGENSQLEYRLTGEAGPFTISNSTGWIIVQLQLDREAVEFYSFGAEAQDRGQPSLSTSALVSIQVLDVNDNAPQFTQNEYQARLNEDAVVGTSVLTVLALDRDSHATITYQITSGNARHRFSISSLAGGGGLLTLALPLDYKLERQFILTVTASDGMQTDTTLAVVNVTDANTHRPVFQSSHYTVSVREDQPPGTTVVIISASDEDTGENARITYVAEEGMPQFAIHPDTGAVTTTMELDYEDQISYTLAITAHDNGIPQKSDTTYLEILVTDVNDNFPVFQRGSYSGAVPEDAPPYTSVLQISATDLDSGLNGRVFYTFTGGDDGDGDFTVEYTSGIVRTLRQLDRENIVEYSLTAYAVDKGHPTPHRTPVEVIVTVLDVNDNAPVFARDELQVMVLENSPLGPPLATITASDPDEGPNAQIMYQIVEGNIPEIFQLDIFSGELTALVDLDFEERPEYLIVVQATSAPLVSRATVRIRLIDVNDNSPTLSDFRVVFNHYVGGGGGSFPSGVIGRVPAHDPDVSDMLSFTFLQGNELGLLLLNTSSGELSLSRDLDSNRPLEATMEVAVTDGIHRITAQCTLQVAIITDEMLSHSITLRLGGVSQYKFLSPLLPQFIHAVAHVLSIAPPGVVVFSIRDDSEALSLTLGSTTNGQILNVSLLVQGPEGAYLPSETLRELLYLNRTLLATLAQQKVLPFDDNVCLREPCPNYMLCVSALRFDSSAPFLASDTLLFRPILPVGGLRCRCPTGFAGDYCETEVDLCYTGPCGQHGICRSHEGGYTCQCQDDYTGPHCEISLSTARCSAGLCRNGAACVNLLVGGFHCECPSEEYEAPYCTVTTRTFDGESFLTFRGLRQRFHFTLSLSFATREQNGLLMYNGRFNGKHDFIVLEVKDEQVQLTFSAGEFTTTVSPFLPGGVSDGQWHTVYIHYYNKPIVGKSGDLQGPSDHKVAVVTIDDCNAEMSLRFGDILGSYSCAAQGMQSGTKKSLDLTGPLLLGGIPNLPEDFPVLHRYFVGCMKDLVIDNKAMDLGNFIANNGTAPGCPAKKNQCEGKKCQHGGTCVNRWDGYSCECPLGYGGKDCELDMLSSLRFLGNGALLWKSLLLPLIVPWQLSLMLRTRQSDAVLLQAEGEMNCSLTLQMSQGSLIFSLRGFLNVQASLSLPHVKLNDGIWHHIAIELQNDPKVPGTHLLFQIDYGQDKVEEHFPSDLFGATLNNLSVGAVTFNGNDFLQGFRGCLQGVRVGSFSSPLSLANALFLNVESGCSFPDPCDSNPCPVNSYCRDDWDNYSCACHQGYYGNNCIDACDLNPCKHQSTCVRHLNGPYGCECASGFYGSHCENRLDQPCSRGWWGHPVCGPCNCDASKGFDTDCNKTTGECHCKDNHYRLPGAEVCILCDCYAIGSLSRTCEPSTGQCPCKPGVIGQHCDHCDNPFAEVTFNGCEVNYDSCPRAIEADIWWLRTRFGLPAAVSCPRGSVGTAVRHCDEHKGWLPPDLSNCTSHSLIPLKGLLDTLRQNMSLLSSTVAQKGAQDLLNATKSTDPYMNSDVHISYQLLSTILQKQSQESGFNLAATQDVHFTENVVKIGSYLLDLDTKEHWDKIQVSEAGTALLLKHYETYVGNLARNMKYTYLNPFAINTPNIVVSVAQLDKANFAGAVLPRYDTLRGVKPNDQETAVILPIPSFMSHNVNDHLAIRPHDEPSDQSRTKRDKTWQESTQRDSHAVVTVIIYHSLGILLPEKWDPDKRSLRIPKRPVINSPVVSINIYGTEGGALDQPITVQFKLRETQERSKPICVHWNHSLQLPITGGGWSARGCELVFRNETHISCQCHQMTSFAVLMDMSRRENGEVLPLRIITYSCLWVTLSFLLLSLLFLSIPRSLHSNQHSIHRNLLLALLMSQLSFLLGINQADMQFACTIIAILLHFLSLCCFSWTFLEVLHLYRRLSEVRDVNGGPMRFYYALGWGVPAFITGLAVGLDPEGYGNPDFCWLSISDTLIWSFAGPAAFVISTGLFLCVISGRVSCAAQRKGFHKKGTTSGLRCAIVLLLLVSVSWVLALLSINSDLLLLHYMYAGVVCAQGPLIFMINVIFSKDVHRALKRTVSRMNEPSVTTKSTMISSHAGNTYVDGHFYHMPFGSSTGSLHSSLASRGSHCYLPFLLRDEAGLKDGQALPELNDHNDSDSDSDLSMDDDHSCSFASTQSSDSADEDDADSPGVSSWEVVTSLNNEKMLQTSTKVDNVKSEKAMDNVEMCPTDQTVRSPKQTTPRPQKGILKKKHRSLINRIHNELGHRTKPSLQEQLNGVTPMSIRTHTAGKESSESESNETSI